MRTERPIGYIAFSLEPTQLTPGRLRLRFPQMRDNGDFFASLLGPINQQSDVLAVSVRPHTGSLLIQFDGRLDDLITRLHHLSKFDLLPRERVPKEMLRSTIPKLTPKEIATMKLLIYGALGTLQSLNGRPLGPGTSMLDAARGYWNEIRSLVGHKC